MIFPNNGKETIEISKELRILLKREPPCPGGRLVLRAAIMGYELGPVQQFAVYHNRLNMQTTRLRGFEENAKLGMADLLTQCRMFCLEAGWDFDDIQKMGLVHLQERHSEFKEDGWAEK